MKCKQKLLALVAGVAIFLAGCSSQETPFPVVPVEPTAIDIAVQRGLEESCRDELRLFAERLVALSENTLALSIVYVDDPYAALQAGEADIIYLDNDQLAQGIPSFAIYTSPFYLQGYERVTMSLNSPNFYNLTEQEFEEEWGLRQLAAVWAGSSVLVSSDHYISDVQDFTDTTIAIETDKYLSYLLGEMGARVTQVAQTDRYEQFSEGELDTIECRTEDLLQLDFTDPENAYLIESFHHNQVEWLFVSSQSYNKLSAVQQAALEEAAATLISTLESKRYKQYVSQREALDTAGVEVTRFSYTTVFKEARDILYANKEFNAQTDWNRYDAVLAFIR